MDKRAIITNVEIITEKNIKKLDKSELKRFNDERVQINVTIVDDSFHRTSACRVVLNKMSPMYIQNALSGNITKIDQKHKVKSKVRFFETCMFEVQTLNVYILCYLFFSEFLE